MLPHPVTCSKLSPGRSSSAAGVSIFRMIIATRAGGVAAARASAGGLSGVSAAGVWSCVRRCDALCRGCCQRIACQPHAARRATTSRPCRSCAGRHGLDRRFLRRTSRDRLIGGHRSICQQRSAWRGNQSRGRGLTPSLKRPLPMRPVRRAVSVQLCRGRGDVAGRHEPNSEARQRMAAVPAARATLSAIPRHGRSGSPSRLTPQ